jgi:hypothetical protein
LLDIESPWTAYCLDNAVVEFGVAVENELASVEGKNKKELKVKSERVMRKWLDAPVQFREPPRAALDAARAQSRNGDS